MLQRNPPAAACGGIGRAWRRGLAGSAVWLAALLSSACGAAPPPAEVGVVTIGGATYRLPASVFEELEPPQGPQDSMLLFLPVLAGPDDPTAEPVQVLLVAPFAANAQERERKVRESIALEASIAAMPGLARRGQPLLPAAQRVSDAPRDLVQVAADPQKFTINDVFVRPPLKSTAEYIYCNRLGGIDNYVKYPLCFQGFAAPGMKVKATYPRAELPKWDAIRRAVLAYLQSHRTA